MEDRRAELRQLIRSKRDQRTGGASRAPSALPDPQTLMLAAGIDDAEALKNAPALMDVARKIASSSGGMRGALEQAARADASDPPRGETGPGACSARSRRGGKRHRARKARAPAGQEEELDRDAPPDASYDAPLAKFAESDEEAPPPASDDDDEAPPPGSDD